MKKFLILFCIFFVGISGYTIYFVSAQLPKLAQQQAQKTLQDMGFEGIQLAQPDIRITAARFENIKLDEEGISTIDGIEIQYSPFTLLVMKQPSVVIISGLTLVGELMDAQAIDVAGWNAENAKLNLQNGNLRRLVIQDSRLSLLTDEWGGINIDYSLQMRTRGKQVDIEGTLRSQQKHISVIASAKGFINRDGLWQADFKVSQGKLDIPPVKATRVNGTIKVSGAPNSSPLIVSELQAGGANIHGFPWQNASSTFEGSINDFTVFTDMKSIGYKGVELGLNIQKKHDALSIEGTLHGETFGQLVDYLGHRKTMPFNKDALEPYSHLTGITLNFETNDVSAEDLHFTLSDAQQNIKISGDARIEDKKFASATMSSNAFFLKHIETLMAPNQTNLGSGHMKLSGTIENKDETARGNLKADISDGSLVLSPLRLEKISGTLVIDDIQTLSSNEPQKLECSTALKLEQNCTLHLTLKNGALELNKISIEVLEGTLSIDDYAPSAPPQKMTVKGSKIDFWALSQALDLEGLNATGTFKLELPLHQENGELIIRGGSIRNEGKGVIRYLYDENPAFFEGDEFEMETMKQALKNYHYEFFEIKLNGSIHAPDIFVVGRGYNPDMFERRSIALNFKTKADSKALFKNILP